MTLFNSYEAACPNYCHRHGFCNEDNICTCSDGYTGPDCSHGKRRRRNVIETALNLFID